MPGPDERQGWCQLARLVTIVTDRSSGGAALYVLPHEHIDMRRVEEWIGSERRFDPLRTGEEAAHLVVWRNTARVVQRIHHSNGNLHGRAAFATKETGDRAAVEVAAERKLRVGEAALAHA